MNKRKIIYIIALILSLLFICVVAFNQSSMETEKVSKNNKDKLSIKTVDKCDDITNEQPITTIHQEEIQMQEDMCDYMQVYQEYPVPSNRGFKSYMSYTSITSQSSPQFILQSQYAYTGEFGIRQVDGRFCVAIGTFSNAKIGTYVDLILENETVIPCIVGDFKSVLHTDSNNKITSHNGCVSEFLIDISSLHTTAKRMGDISYCMEEWKSPVKIIKVYEKNVFDGE